jgi:hypothetical protein
MYRITKILNDATELAAGGAVNRNLIVPNNFRIALCTTRHEVDSLYDHYIVYIAATGLPTASLHSFIHDEKFCWEATRQIPFIVVIG